MKDLASHRVPIRWCRTLSEFESSGADADGPITILEPGTAAEKARRTTVLKELLATESESEPPQDGDVVVALDDMAERSLRSFAARQGRSFRRVQAFSEVFPLAEMAETKSLLVCSRSSNLPAGPIMELNASSPVPWGIFTGNNEADLSFLAAKALLTSRRATGRHAGMYAIGEHAYTISTNDGTLEKGAYDETVVKQLLEQRLDSLTLASHGGAGHLRLGPIHICNPSQFTFVAEEDNRYLCATRGTARHCRRISDPNIVILSCGCIRATSLVIFACSMVTQHQGMYASDFSAFLSVAGGYPSEIITTDQLIAIPPRAVEVSVRLAAAGICAGWRTRLMNDICLQQNGSAPLLLMGDPRGPRPGSEEPERWFNPRPNGSFAVNVRFINEHNWENPKIIAPQERGAMLLRGRSQLTVIRGKAEVTDMSEVFDAVERWFVTLGRRVQDALRLEHIIRLAYCEMYPENSSGLTLLVRMAAVRAELEPAITTALVLLERCEATGTWDEELHTLRNACSRGVQEWNETCATLVNDFLISRTILSFLVRGWRLEGRQMERKPCIFCGADTVLESYSDRIYGKSRATVRNCPRCGELAFWSDALGPVQIAAAPTIHSGQRNLVEFVLEPPNVEGLLKDGLIVWRLLDKGNTDDKLCEKRVCTPGSEVRWSFKHKFTADIHELVAVAVMDMSVSASFRSWPAVS